MQKMTNRPIAQHVVPEGKRIIALMLANAIEAEQFLDRS